VVPFTLTAGSPAPAPLARRHL